jgi:hypothetical protein
LGETEGKGGCGRCECDVSYRSNLSSDGYACVLRTGVDLGTGKGYPMSVNRSGYVFICYLRLFEKKNIVCTCPILGLGIDFPYFLFQATVF